jgi:hypothetical protein
MNGSAIDTRIRFHLFLWYGFLAFAVLVLGFFLAASPVLLAIMITGLAWLVLLPYHAQVAFYLALTTFSSAFILPLVPGRPYMWEFAALLGWTGVIIMGWLRRYRPEFPQLLREHRWLFLASFAYCTVLVVTMFLRGVGLRILGSGQAGGRLYFQQLICAVFPLLLLMIRTDERLVTRLFTWQYLLAGTYLVSDLVFALTPQAFWTVLYFLEVPSDAVNFERQSMHFGIRRFQSFAYFGQAFIFFLLMYYSLRDFVSRRSLWLVPLVLGVLSISLLSGHRWVFVIVGLTVFFAAYAQRFFNVHNLVVTGGILVVVLVLLYAYAYHTPQAFQRSISFLPGIHLDGLAKADADNTVQGRRILLRIGMELVPQYFWLGRGFARFLDEYATAWDPSGIMWHVSQGVFYNGFVGLLVNTGIFGTVFMLSFLALGTREAWRIIQLVRTHGCPDTFTRLCSVVSSLWLANLIAFLFLHGDSEFAMKTFSLQAGTLLVCRHLLRRRWNQAQAA